jgi:hypothetical protein
MNNHGARSTSKTVWFIAARSLVRERSGSQHDDDTDDGDDDDDDDAKG